MKDQLLQIINRERMTVPSCNHRNYDLECESFVNAILASPESFENLTTILWNRIQGFKRHDKSMCPPMLARLKGESSEDHLERCYQAGGYVG